MAGEIPPLQQKMNPWLRLLGGDMEQPMFLRLDEVLARPRLRGDPLLLAVRIRERTHSDVLSKEASALVHSLFPRLKIVLAKIEEIMGQ